MIVSRRNFLKTAGATAIGFAAIPRLQAGVREARQIKRKEFGLAARV